MTMIFEAFRVRHRNEVMLETLHFGEAMKFARESSSKRGKWIVDRLSSKDHYDPVGYWQDGIWWE